MSDERIGTAVPTVFSPRERAQLVAKALSEAARRARFSTKHRRNFTSGGFRARRGEKLFRILRIASFVGVVAVPSFVVTCYYLFVASDQYTSEARFTVRGGMPPKLDGIGSLTGVPSILIIQDTQIIMNYIQSRAMVEQLDKAVGLRALYSNPAIDAHSRLKDNVKIEKFLRYWKSMIEMSVQMPAGIVVFTVKAFSPDDATRIADAALEASEILVNQMNDQMIKDTIDVSEKERQRAEANLATTRANLEKARNEEGMLSADKSAEALNGLITQVRGELAKMQQDYDTQRRYVTANSPTIRNLQAKISAANDEIARLQSHLTQSADGEATKNLAGSMSKLEYMTLENQIAEKMYAASLTLLEHARLASETKLMYINTFVRPVPAQEAKYPRRALDIGLFIAAALACWGALIGILGLVRNKLA
ncbi:lipopolysaccharide biosynthesis protein [Beijerinckia sp. L45]|uniref:lipopolysaccharide biosynthesis protein n=1 Tax=Beijerinckia sp. L45 TaxID=1641855 RepID=UPI00131DCFFE|nr:lipopolysaccharide biosynthesis protein [Beijerinckia sp. L45]